MTFDRMVGIEVAEPQGTSKCDVCGLDTPHGHTEFDVIQQRYARKAFQDRYKNVVTSSWDGDTSSIIPMVRGPRPEDGYWGQEDNRRWQTYVNAWLDAWEHFRGRIKEQDDEIARHLASSKITKGNENGR